MVPLDPSLRRFLWLYARSRHLLPIVAVGLALLAVGSWWIAYAAPNIVIPNDKLNLRMQTATLVPLVAGVLLGLSVASPNGELEEAAPEWPRRTRGGATLVLLGLLGGSYALVGSAWALEDASWLLVRNLGGFLGGVLGVLPLLGASRAWMPAIAWGGVSIFSQRLDGTYPTWAWSMQPSDDAASWLLAGALFVLGLAALVRAPLAPRSG